MWTLVALKLELLRCPDEYFMWTNAIFALGEALELIREGPSCKTFL